MTDLSYSVVIPTKDRPERARAAVDQALAQTRRPAEVVVVDASEPPLALDEGQLRRAAELGVALTVEHAAPSTSAQRNRGVELVRAPIVLFLDDDVTLPVDYAATLVGRWEEIGLDELGGITGSVRLRTVPPQGLSRPFRRALQLYVWDSEGDSSSMRRSLKMSAVPSPPREVYVPAVNTCAVAFRRDVAQRFPFDERFPGYALGEDLDMSLRVSAEYPILQTPATSYGHEKAPEGRESARAWRQRGLCESFFRLRHLPADPVSYVAFAVSVAAEGGLAAAASLRARDPGPLRAYAGGLAEALRLARRERRGLPAA
jgi:GT2 family glycosyltransferase